MRRGYLVSLVSGVLLLFLDGMLHQRVAASSQLQPLPIDRALSVSLPAPNSLELTPDGHYSSYMTCNGQRKWQLESHKAARNLDDSLLGCQIHVLNVLTNTDSSIVADSVSAYDARWSPNGRFLAYLVPAGSNTDQLYVWNRDTKRSRLISRLRIESNSYPPIWMPGSDALIVAAHRNPPPTYHMKSTSGGTGTTVIIYRSPKDFETDPAGSSKPRPSPGPWPISGSPVALALVNLQTGSTRILTSDVDAAAVDRIYLSPDCRYIAYAVATKFDGPESQQTLDDIRLLSLSDEKTVTIATGVPMAFGSGINWSPRANYLAWLTSGVHASGKLYIYKVQSGKTEIYTYAGKRLPGFNDYSPVADMTLTAMPIWDSNGSNVYIFDLAHQNAIWEANISSRILGVFFKLPGERVTGVARPVTSDVVGLGGQRTLTAITQNVITKRTSVYSVNLDSKIAKKIWEQNAKLSQLTCSHDCKTLAYFQERTDESPDIWVSSADMRQQHRLTDIAPLFDTYKLGRSRIISWRPPNGKTLEGVVILPAGYVSGKRYPLIVFPYPGSYKSNSVQFAGYEGPADTVVDDMQLLATRGYAILLPDAPYRKGQKMRDLFDEIMAGVDKAIALGIADPDRLGVMGHSDGGYTVLGLIIQTHRFKAAVSRSGFSDVISQAFQMDDDGSVFSLNIEEDVSMGGSLWAMPQRWIANSPIFFFDHVNTPLLITHGGGDIYVQKSAARETFVALRRLNKIVQYAEYGGEGHAESTWSYPNQVDYVTRMIAWFDRFLCSHRVSPVSCD